MSIGHSLQKWTSSRSSSKAGSCKRQNWQVVVSSSAGGGGGGAAFRAVPRVCAAAVEEGTGALRGEAFVVLAGLPVLVGLSGAVLEEASASATPARTSPPPASRRPSVLAASISAKAPTICSLSAGLSSRTNHPRELGSTTR